MAVGERAGREGGIDLMDDVSCSGCYFSVPTVTDDEQLTTKCRRYPPALVMVNGDLMQAFPDASHICGEYRPERMIE